MLIAVDIGNTNIVLGFIDRSRPMGEAITHTYRLTTSNVRTSDEYGVSLLQFLQLSGYTVDDVEDVIVCSVVPNVMHSFRGSILKFLRKTPIIVGPGIKTGMRIQIDDPRSLGADCLTDCVAAYTVYGGPCLVIDMGTATTFNYVDEAGAITMGVIQTGLQTSARALAGNTAQLPEVEIKAPTSVLAKNTNSAIQTGLYYGFIGGIERFISECRREIGTDFQIIATGGFGHVIEHDAHFIDVYDPDLIFKGLRLIYEKNL
ncbi:pantothenate kinase [Alloscardovia macacae]|uniref:Type III pantothenate kinase n=1 Tax=Alloscardovia macacae TaxID=1160091 RepID=A0A1Y2SYP2_9BIFI|nr:type III pantothenate kinase [Alloscardovia macacae]OTA27400.1 pantothenate kinase [Alloscardovia macacae]OTA29412.1 pantothenate kinase [Alloscardovia macacae]